jgi:hypothetical protein
MKTLALLAVALLVAACGRPFDVETASGFVEVEEEAPVYDYRAVAPDGVAVAVRAVEVDEETDLGFWERAVTLRMRELEGYALLERREVKSRSGAPGRELVFGHDEEGKPYLYRMRLFRADQKLYVIEAGGTREQMQRWQGSVDFMLASFRID